MHNPFWWAAGSSLALLLLYGCASQPPAVAPRDVNAVPVTALPTGPDDPAWSQAPELVAPLILQDMVEPRQMTVTTPEVRVRALRLGNEVAFRLDWDDATLDDISNMEQFCDACAVQLPTTAAPTVPAPQMGEPGQSVEISYWRAAWQAIVDGREDSLKAYYPNAAIDHYPFDAAPLKKDSPEQQEMAAVYAPARALGNLMSAPPTAPVQDLVSAGPGTLAPAQQAASKGSGKRTATGWSVMIIRRLPANFDPHAGTQVAFAVWDGAHREVGARKMRTAWIPLITTGKDKL